MILDERVSGAYRPHLVLPFQIGMKRAVDMLKKEFKSRVFTPSTFLAESTLEEMKGMYVPFWMYDYGAKINYTGKGTKVRVWVGAHPISYNFRNTHICKWNCTLLSPEAHRN